MCLKCGHLFSGVFFPAEQASELQDTSHSQSHENQWSLVLTGTVSAAVCLVLVVYAVINCTDCYKSEVSTEFHPATASSGVKWGGAGGYSAATTHDVNNSTLSAGFIGEVVPPGEGGSQPLPYAMIPAHVPEAQGFCGYGPSQPAGGQGLSGYSAPGGGGAPPGNVGGQWGGAGQGGGGPQHFPGAHSSPLAMQEPEEPPPPYFDSSYH